MTVAEKDKLIQKNVPHIRLSCQIRCDRDMTVRAISRLEGSGRPDAARRRRREITPEPQWVAAMNASPIAPNADLRYAGAPPLTEGLGLFRRGRASNHRCSCALCVVS